MPAFPRKPYAEAGTDPAIGTNPRQDLPPSAPAPENKADARVNDETPEA